MLTASPTIHTTFIKQFWSTAKVKTVNDEVRVQALIDANRVNIKESSIRSTLQLDDEDGTSCLANDEFFTGLANMGYEKISDKLTFYKAFFSPQWKFLIHTILQCLSAKTTSWNEFSSTMASAIICLTTNQKFNFSRYILLSLVKSIEVGVPFYMFPRVGTGFFGVITPLFENMLVPAAKEVGQAQDDVSIHTEPSTSKPHKKHKSKKHQPIAPKVPSPEPSLEHQLPLPSNDPIPTATDSLKLHKLMDLCTQLSNKVLDLESEVIDIKSSFTENIEKLEDRVYKLEEENRILKEKSFKSTKIDTTAPVVNTAEPTTTAAQVPKASAPRRRRGVVIQDPKETATSVIMHTEVQSEDKGKGILIEEPKPLKGQAQIKQDEVFARQLEAELNVNINWNDVLEQVKRSERQNNVVMRYRALKRKPLIEAQARKNMMIYLKNMAEEEVTVQEKEIEEEGNKRQGESLEQEIAKKQRMDEEAKEFKRHLQINFDREDLETLWKLIKERFETTEPKNFSDDFLLNILKIMFEKPNIEANVWKDRKGKYGLAKKMLNNVRLEVKEESEVSLELLRLVRRQSNEGYVPE
uniref:Synaptobrevin, longin-like domain protein n=1 Tax=Tanacetum cinerariifolium TaxID=118510 RepID=A0A6L2MMG8_TANCI|nr:synaptobrevin, longin-like domain protein [Tanacetum cinerariifolium]